MRWGSLLRFGGAPVEEGKQLAASLRGPLTPRYLFLSCDLDSEPGIAADAYSGALFREGVGHVSHFYPFPLGSVEAKLPFHQSPKPLSLFLIALYFS